MIRKKSMLQKIMLLKMATGGGGGGTLTEYTVTGNPASFETNVSKPLTQMLIPISPVQAEGIPSIVTPLPITGRTGVNVTNNGKNIPVTFTEEAGTVYGGSLDLTTGVLTVTHALIEFDGATSGKKITDKGSATAFDDFYLNKSDAFLYDTGKSTTVPNDKLDLYGYKCSHGIYYDAETIDSVKFAVRAYISSSRVFQPRISFAKSEEISTVSLCNAWLADQYANGTPVQIWYALKTEQTYQIDRVPISARKGMNVIGTDTSGDNEIKYLVKEG